MSMQNLTHLLKQNYPLALSHWFCAVILCFVLLLEVICLPCFTHYVILKQALQVLFPGVSFIFYSGA